MSAGSSLFCVFIFFSFQFFFFWFVCLCVISPHYQHSGTFLNPPPPPRLPVELIERPLPKKTPLKPSTAQKEDASFLSFLWFVVILDLTA